MHTPIERVIEILIFTIINTVPYHLCAIYPFRKNLRFSWPVTIAVLTLSTCVELAMNELVGFGIIESNSFVNWAWSMAYLLGYFLIVKIRPGKVVFLILVLLNIANFNTVATKGIENILFPFFAVERYHYSASLIMLGVQLVVLLPFFFFIKQILSPAIQRNSTGSLWLYNWVVPFTFYFLWHYHIHFGASGSLEVAGDPHTTLFLFVINACAVVIYYIVAKTLRESDHNAQLRTANHQLELQTIQYESLQERIMETRRANHDLRHHITAMNSYLEKEDYESLKAYFKAFSKHLPSSSSMVYTQHSGINMVLAYFAQVAHDNRIRFDVKMDIPATLPVSDSDLTVLLGNLVENAIEACCSQKQGERIIRICGQQSGDTLLFTIDNTYDNPIKINSAGVYMSSKHSGEGIGIESARSIAGRLGGYLDVTQQEGYFCISIVIRL